MRRIKRNFLSRATIADYFFRGSISAICTAALSFSAAFATDFDVDTINDSGPGSLRDGLAEAQSGDRLIFQSVLNGATLINGGPLKTTTNVTFTNLVPINVTDNHTISLSDPLYTSSVVNNRTVITTTPLPLTINWTGGSLTLNGLLTDGTSDIASGSLVKTGNGALILTNANTYTGGTTISGGTLFLTNQNAIGTGTLTANSTTGVTAPVLQLGSSFDLSNDIALSTTLTVLTQAGAVNQLSGLISGSGSAAVLKAAGGGTLILSGTNTFGGGVTAADGSIISLLSNRGLGTGTLTTEGSLRLDLADGVAADNRISLGDGLTVNVNSGAATLSGVIGNTTTSDANTLTKTGAGTLILISPNTYGGRTTVTDGTLQGSSTSFSNQITNNASLVFNQTGAGVYAGTIDGVGNITKIGNGTLTFSGTSSVLTPLNLNAGGLAVTGSMASPILVNSPTALLSGTGSVGTIINSGIVKPSSIGSRTLTVNGDYVQQPTGTTRIQIDSGAITPGSSNDQLKVNGQIKLDGELKVLTRNPNYVPGTRYTMMTSTGGVTGTFRRASTNDYRFGADVTYGANDVEMELKPTTSLYAAAVNGNQASLGRALDNIVFSTTGTEFANGPLFSLINSLGIQSVDEQRQGMNQLSGSMYGNLQTVGLQIGNQFQQMVTNSLVSNVHFLAGGEQYMPSDQEVRGQYPTSEITRGWVQGFGVGGNIRSDGNGGSANYTQGGALFGIDGGRDDTGVVGLAGGSSYAKLNNDFNSNTQITSYQIGTYALKHDDTSYLLGTMNYGYNSYFSHRDITIPGSEQSLRANFSGNQFGANIESGLKITAGIFHIQPLVGLQYLYLSQQGFEEEGGSAALLGNRTRAHSLRSNIGIRALLEPWVDRNAIVWTPFTQARLVTEWLDNDRFVNATFNDVPASGAFTTHGTAVGYNYGVFGEGLEVRINDAWSIYGNVDLIINDRLSIITGSLASVTRW